MTNCSIKCPNCDEEMHSLEVVGGVLYECIKCGFGMAIPGKGDIEVKDD